MAIIVPSSVFRPIYGLIFIICGLHDFRYTYGALGLVVMGIAQALMGTPLIKVQGDMEAEGFGLGAAFRVGSILWCGWSVARLAPAVSFSLVLLAAYQGLRATGTLLLS
jgi:hypothetical protein